MKPTRRFRLLTVLVMLCTLLLSQAVLASYACPGAAKAAEIAAMAEAGMPCAQAMAGGMDEEQPGLCHAHCQSGQQSAESYHPPVFADLMSLGPVLSVELPALPSASASAMQRPLLVRQAGPPLAVRNCCFRI
jgi:hypothetical protein